MAGSGAYGRGSLGLRGWWAEALWAPWKGRSVMNLVLCNPDVSSPGGR